MNDQLSATIIPFPVRFNRTPTNQVPVAPVRAAAGPVVLPARKKPNELVGSAQRLNEALAGLSSALADQRDATQRWKAALEDLAAKMRSLGEIDGGKKKSG